jgi:hypothetical protein
VDEVNVAMSATDGFGLKNQGLTVDQQVEMLAAIIAGRANAEGEPGAAPSLSATMSCVWGCPFDGEVAVGSGRIWWAGSRRWASTRSPWPTPSASAIRGA